MKISRLIIAEKPSLARAIVEVLPKPHVHKENYIECGQEDVVAWCAGHILKLADPDAYSEEYSKWSLKSLPIVPDTWQYHISSNTKSLFDTLRSLLTKTDTVIHAGDPDREGQLLIDEVLQKVNFKGNVLRVLINDMNKNAVQKAMNNLQSNKEFFGLSQAAEARSKADWLYGLNMTRLYTLLGQNGGYSDVLSVGRVQTPLLGLIVRRDLEIENFVPKPYYRLVVNFQASTGTFSAIWQAGEEVTDEENRIINKEKAQEIERKIQDKEGIITECERKKKFENNPFPYNLAELQVDAGQKLGFSAKETLDICQVLYEKHKVITYPRSDCSYLPEEHFTEVPTVLAAVTANISDLSNVRSKADEQIKNRAWDDKKISAHHAIIPTPTISDKLNDKEQAIYQLVCRRYLAQFFPVMEYLQTILCVTIEEEKFKTTGRQIVNEGWQVVYQTESKNEKPDDKEADSLLPLVDNGDRVKLLKSIVQEKKTQPPERFTDGSIIKAMTNVAKFVSNSEIKQILKETDGIGTPATQAQIIQILFDRNYVEKKGKYILSTPTGRMLISILPEVATTPDMTAMWEMQMREIVDKKTNLSDFLLAITSKLQDLVASGKTLRKLTLSGVDIYPCPTCQNALRRNEGKKKGTFYWLCPDRDCAQDFMTDREGKPVEKEKFACKSAECTGLLIRRPSKKGGFWWGCSEYRNGCKFTALDANGKPNISL